HRNRLMRPVSALPEIFLPDAGMHLLHSEADWHCDAGNRNIIFLSFLFRLQLPLSLWSPRRCPPAAAGRSISFLSSSLLLILISQTAGRMDSSADCSNLLYRIVFFTFDPGIINLLL